MRSVPRITDRGHRRQGKLIDGTITSTGYIFLRIFRDSEQRYITTAAHRLVAITWIPNPDNLPQIDHIDMDRMNNAVENMRWCTRTENLRWASKLNEEDVLEIRDILSEGGTTQRALAERFGVSKQLIGRINAGEVWRGVHRKDLRDTRATAG